jgi:YidC/Oxa1 family membrane protein insertase
LDLDQLHNLILQHGGGVRTLYWNVLLVEPLMRGLSFLGHNLGLGGALAIIIFTILIRVVLLPLTLQQIKSQKAMQKLQPEIKALQKKYGNDREKISQETMALYKEHGVNPAASCLPMALQMPVLFALYAAMRNLGSDPNYAQVPEFHAEPFHQGWLWLTNLNSPDIIHIPGLAFPIPFILPILAALTQWVQQRMMTQQTDDPQQKMQNQMMQFMPLMMLYFGISFASGLALYWVTQNIFGIVQQYFSTGWGSLIPGRASAPPNGTVAGTTQGNSKAAGSGAPANGRESRAAAVPVNGTAVTARERRNGRDKRAAAPSGVASAGTSGNGEGSRAKREGRRASGKR